MSSTNKELFKKVLEQLKTEFIADFDSRLGQSDSFKSQLKEYYVFCLSSTIPAEKVIQGFTLVKE